VFPSGACVENCSQVPSEKVYDPVLNEVVEQKHYSIKNKFCVKECPGMPNLLNQRKYQNINIMHK